MNKVYIHIGLPKTATSSIQSFLYDNAPFLDQHGYHYIQTGLNHSLKCHHDMIWKLGLHKGPSYVEKDIEKYKDEIIENLSAEVANTEGKDLILSSELLTFVHDFKRLRPLLDIFKNKKIKFILNLRRQDKFLESLYQQVVKDGISLEFGEWLHRSRGIGDYDMLIKRLLQITSKKDIIVDIFDTRIPDLHPIESFLLSLGFDRNYIKNFNIANVKENESLSREQISKLQASNILNPNLRYELMKEFTEKNNNTAIEKAKYLNKEERQKVIRSFRNSNKKLINMLDMPLSQSKYLLI